MRMSNTEKQVKYQARSDDLEQLTQWQNVGESPPSTLYDFSLLS